MQHMGIIELEAVQIELDRTPGMRRLQISEIIGQLGFGQLINVLIEILANAANGAGVGLYRLGLQSFEF
jgi:hypothetical protein